jgi:protocatechuate 3,4-dioxygenase beta subunit
MLLTRRSFIRLLPAPLGALVLAACGGDDDEPSAPSSTEPASQPAGATPQASGGGNTSQQLTPTPACGDDDDLTPAQTEGPYFTPNSPQRTSLLESGISGTTLVVTGFVYTRSCQPVANALVDFWQADGAGAYDNTGYRLRGHQFTDATGRFRLETIEPGLYPGRTRHIHVKVQAPSRPVLTTQLYFPNEAGNARDGIFSADLLMAVRDTGANAKASDFNFVLDVA